MEITKNSHDSRLFSEASLSPRVDCAPPSHSSLDATLWRALEACSAHLARVDRGRPCAMQSYAVGCVHRRHLLPRPPRPHPGRTFFTPVALPNVSRSDGGVSRPRGARLVGFERPELTRRNPHVSPKHPQERPERLTIGRERPMDGARRAARCAPVANFSPRRPTPRLSRTHPFSHALAESHRFPGVALPSPASDIAAFPAFAQGNIFRGMRPRATAALTPSASRRPTPVRPTAPAFSPFESPDLTVEARSAADVSARGAPRAGRCRGVCVDPGGVADALTRDMDTPAPRPSGEPARRPLKDPRASRPLPRPAASTSTQPEPLNAAR